MKIIENQNEPTIEFKQLYMGDIFKWDGKYYYKIGFSYQNDNAVMIFNGDNHEEEPDQEQFLCSFLRDDQVTPVNAELNVHTIWTSAKEE